MEHVPIFFFFFNFFFLFISTKGVKYASVHMLHGQNTLGEHMCIINEYTIYWILLYINMNGNIDCEYDLVIHYHWALLFKLYSLYKMLYPSSFDWLI